MFGQNIGIDLGTENIRIYYKGTIIDEPAVIAYDEYNADDMRGCRVFELDEKDPANYKTFFGYWKNDGFYKRKAKGRADYDGTWNTVKSKWLSTYFNREEIPGFSVKKEVTASDEWCAEAYMETDYAQLSKCSFEKTIKERQEARKGIKPQKSGDTYRHNS